MFYPLNLNGLDIYPLFGNALQGVPHLFDFSSENPQTMDYTTTDFDAFEDAIVSELQSAGRTWGIGRYLEERGNLLRDYPNIIEEGRVYHLGLDVIAPFETPLFAPLAAEVYEVGNETVPGNYGGYIILRHVVNEVPFYSFYGHLQTPALVTVGQRLEPGEIFARLGRDTDSGGWFCHVHLQIMTQRAVDEGLTHWGYATPAFMPQLPDYFPSPYALFRY